MPREFKISLGETTPEWLAQQIAASIARGDDDGAIGLLAGAANNGSSDPGLWLTLGVLTLQRARTADASQALRRSLPLAPQYSFALHLLGVVFERLGDPVRAERFHLRCLAIDPLESLAWLQLGRLALSGELPAKSATATSCLRRSICLAPSDAMALYHHGLAEIRREDVDVAAKFLARALCLEPRWDQAKSDLAGVRRLQSGARRTQRPAVWPQRRASFDQLEKVIDQYIFRPEPPAERFLTRQTAFYTFGSCFATHLSSTLHSRGYASRHTELNEEANSTFANRLVLDWLSGLDDPATEEIAAFFGDDLRKAARSFISAADVSVMTLGVAPCFFAKDTGRFVFMSASGEVNLGAMSAQYDFRMTSVAENSSNIRHIVSALRRINPKIRVIFTLSPVPLAGAVGLGSTVLADCLSKSTLRVAVADVLASAPAGVHYFPAFEIVKWLGSHTGRAFFGEEDGNSRHVSNWVVETVISAFIRRHSAEELA